MVEMPKRLQINGDYLFTGKEDSHAMKSDYQHRRKG